MAEALQNFAGFAFGQRPAFGHEQMEAYEVSAESQAAVTLTPPDRRLFLGASLRLFLHRVQHNIPVTSSDIVRLVVYGDPDEWECPAR
jgi:hypothetical protein